MEWIELLLVEKIDKKTIFILILRKVRLLKIVKINKEVYSGQKIKKIF